jgi:hypothetical protein
MAIHSKAYDVEILSNFFSVTIVDVNDYLRVFADACEQKKKKPIPLVQKYTVAEITEKLKEVKEISFYITDTDDTQLFPLISFLNALQPYKDEKGIAHRNDMFGYNSMGYDKLMIAAFLMFATNMNTTKELITKLYETSKAIIAFQDDKQAFYKDYYMTSLIKYQLPYTDVDVMRIFALNKCGKGKDANGNDVYFPKSLKQTSINLQWYELLEYELPPISDKDIHFYHKNVRYKGMPAEQLDTLIDKWDRYMIDEWIPSMIYYNINDVFIVCEIIRLNIDEIRARYNISKAYAVNVLNSSRSNIADILFEKFYSEFSGLHPSQWKGKKTERTKMAFKRVIFPHIKFKTKPLQELLEYMKTVIITSVSKSAFMKEIKLGKLTYTIATGGLHTQDVPRLLKSTDEYTYIHFDMDSYYPFIMYMYGVAPAHMNEGVFTNLMKWLTESRVKAKHTDEEYIDGIAKDIFVLVLKIVINSIYGKFSYEHGDIYDRLATLKVTINGQLMIMMLCEELESYGIEIVSANTDGLVIKLYHNQQQLFEDITELWKNENKLRASSEEYEYYINRDINNYVIRELNGKVTYKGALNPYMYLVDLQKGYDMPIVAKAVVDYFLENKPIMETLYECRNILDFCKTQNVGRQFHVGYTPNGGVSAIKMQRNIRYYVSTNGGMLQKIHNITGKTNRLAANQKVTILNSLDDVPIEYRNINYRYYYDECMKLINPIMLGISPNQKGDVNRRTKSGKSLINKYSGMNKDLFDDNDE